MQPNIRNYITQNIFSPLFVTCDFDTPGCSRVRLALSPFDDRSCGRVPSSVETNPETVARYTSRWMGAPFDWLAQAPYWYPCPFHQTSMSPLLDDQWWSPKHRFAYGSLYSPGSGSDSVARIFAWHKRYRVAFLWLCLSNPCVLFLAGTTWYLI